MDDVLEYARVPVMIQSYTKAQSYAKAMGTPSDKKDNRRDRFRSDAAANSSTSEEVTGLKTNYDGTFTLDGKFYPLKAFVPEEIYLGKIPKVFWDAHRERNMGLSLKLDKKNKNWSENNCNRRTLKSATTKADTKS